jgi:hypothetical protein
MFSARKLTVPVAVGGMSLARSVTVWPTTEGFCEDVMLVSVFV